MGKVKGRSGCDSVTIPRVTLASWSTGTAGGQGPWRAAQQIKILKFAADGGILGALLNIQRQMSSPGVF